MIDRFSYSSFQVTRCLQVLPFATARPLCSNQFPPPTPCWPAQPPRPATERASTTLLRNATFHTARYGCARVATSNIFPPLLNPLNLRIHPTLSSAVSRRDPHIYSSIDTTPGAFARITPPPSSSAVDHTYDLLRPQCRSSAWNSCWHCLWLSRWLPSDSLAYIYDI